MGWVEAPPEPEYEEIVDEGDYVNGEAETEVEVDAEAEAEAEAPAEAAEEMQD